MAQFPAAQTDTVKFAMAAFRADSEVRIEDAYKWLFHATRGGEHALRNEEAARAWLEREWTSLGPPEPGEPSVVSLRPDGSVVRMNLRPWKARGGRADDLFAAFVRSARAFRADGNAFEAAWYQLGGRLMAASLGHLNRAEWERLDFEAKAKGFPAWSHSAPYEKARRPAYRVLAGDEAKKLIASLETRTAP